jgi:Abnormal spindle-like microcephaly-assoc'd, ASPM-SPD-2-Hydin
MILALLVLVGCAGASSNSQPAQQGGNGSAAGHLAVSPATMNFGNVAVGSSTSQTGTLTASSSSVAVSSAAWNGQGYSVSGITFPVTVPAGQSVPFTVTFAPQTTGSTPGSITFNSNASNSPATETLSGAGTQTSVALSWNASTSQVTGYNVYRGSVSGGPYAKINSTLNASTNFTDSSVQPGQTYYYVTTAVDSGGTESAYSNQAQAVIPNP